MGGAVNLIPKLVLGFKESTWKDNSIVKNVFEIHAADPSLIPGIVSDPRNIGPGVN